MLILEMLFLFSIRVPFFQKGTNISNQMQIENIL